MPNEDALVPPLTVAVLHQDREIVSALLNALANPWMNVPVGALHDLPWSPWVPTFLEPVSAVSVAAMQSSDNGTESLHWRRTLAGLDIPRLPPGWLQSDEVLRQPPVLAAEKRVRGNYE